jgi:hypothetical protein
MLLHSCWFDFQHVTVFFVLVYNTPVHSLPSTLSMLSTFDFEHVILFTLVPVYCTPVHGLYSTKSMLHGLYSTLSKLYYSPWSLYTAHRDMAYVRPRACYNIDLGPCVLHTKECDTVLSNRVTSMLGSEATNLENECNLSCQDLSPSPPPPQKLELQINAGRRESLLLFSIEAKYKGRKKLKTKSAGPYTHLRQSGCRTAIITREAS